MRDWFSEREVATFISITWFLLSFYTDVINGCSFYHPCLTFTALTLKRDTVICQLVPLNQRGPTFTKETVATVHLVYCFKQRSRREVVFTFLTGLRQPTPFAKLDPVPSSPLAALTCSAPQNLQSGNFYFENKNFFHFESNPQWLKVRFAFTILNRSGCS